MADNETEKEISEQADFIRTRDITFASDGLEEGDERASNQVTKVEEPYFVERPDL
jgi:hypothetical protein